MLKTLALQRCRSAWLIGFCVFILANAVVTAADTIRIAPLVRDGVVSVSFEFPDGFTDEVRAAIHSGLRTTFTYAVELRLEVPAWIDKTIASVTVSNAVEYDNLTRRYSVSRLFDGRIQEVRITDEDAVVQQLLTTFQRLPLLSTSKLERNREYYVRVRASVPRNAAFYFPWDSRPTGQAKFTFTP